MRLWLTLAAMLALPIASRADPQNPSFYVVNHGGQPMTHVYVSPASASGWGHDRLDALPVGPGGNAAVRLLADASCMNDVRVVYADGHSEERRGVDTCAVDNIVFGQSAPAARSAQAAQNDPSFRIVNRGTADVNEVYATPAGSRNWGHDRLGDDTIAAGSYKVIHMPAGQCMYDVRVVFDDDNTTERRRINLCSITDLPVP